jgi:hypothetical protein
MLVVILSPRNQYSIPSMVTKRKQYLFEITGKDPILKKPFSCKGRRIRLAGQTKRYINIAGNRRPKFGKCGVTARNPLANKAVISLPGYPDTQIGKRWSDIALQRFYLSICFTK